MIKLADVALSTPNREILTIIERDLSLDKMLLMFSRAWPGPASVFLAMPTHYRRWPPWDKPGSILNRFYWPTGASRWGVGAFLATKAQCEALHEACFGTDGTETKEVSLVLTYDSLTEGEEPIEEVKVDFITVLPPIPLYRVTEEDLSTKFGLYMLVCVDTRYHWWNVPCPDFGINESSGVTWETLIEKIGDELALTINVSEIPEYYLRPHRALNLTGEPIPMILDAVCYNVGARLVVTYAGDVYIQRFEDALNAFSQDLTDHPNRQYLAGDSRFFDKF